MRNLLAYFASAAVTVLIIFGTTDATSQQRNLDPTVVSPDVYRTVLENSSVRVIKVTAEDGSKPALHSHPDRVVINLNDCTWLEYSDDGSVVEDTYVAGEVTWEEAVTHGGQTNRVKETCELFEIELK